MCPDPITLEAEPPSGRRLTDKIFIAFDQACVQSDFETAQQLLRVMEMMAKRPAPKRDTRRQESLVAAYKRLWHLLHPNAAPNSEWRAVA